MHFSEDEWELELNGNDNGEAKAPIKKPSRDPKNEKTKRRRQVIVP